MKYLNKILLFSLLVFAFACDKEDDDDNGGMVGGEDPIMMTAEEIAAAALAAVEEKVTINSGWTITGIETNYADLITEIANVNLNDNGLTAGLLGILDAEIGTTQDCETDDILNFVAGGAFDYNDGTKVCDANTGVFLTQDELFFEDGTWSLKDDNTLTITTVFEEETTIIDYTIETLSDTEFVLYNSTNANTATEIETSVYQFTNNLEIEMTMAKAN